MCLSKIVSDHICRYVFKAAAVLWEIFWFFKILQLVKLKKGAWNIIMMKYHCNFRNDFIPSWIALRKKKPVCHLDHSRSKQRTDQRVLVLTLKFLAPQTWFFHSLGVNIRIVIMQLFSADAIVFSINEKQIWPQKSETNWP